MSNEAIVQIFTFYSSSIKGIDKKAILAALKEFTFYSSSIKGRCFYYVKKSSS